MRKKLAGLLVCAILLVSCAINPVTGRRELSLISEQGEIELGRETNGEVCAQYGVYGGSAVESYVSSVGARLVPFSHRPQLPYSFQVLDTPVVNAFAVPGGYVYVTRGALALINTEAELAVVLGHELGHIAARHSVRKMSQMILIQVGLAVGSALSETFAEIAGVAGIGIQLLYLKFSRDDERQADALGVEYARRAGFNPAQMVNFFGSLQSLGDMSGGSSLPGFLSTHPLTSERIRNVTAMLAEGDKSLGVGREVYLRKVDNLVYGNDPRQGYLEGGAFYHPTLRFVFSVPQGWKVQNTARQVTLASADEKAAFVLQAEKSGEGLAVYADRKSGELENRQLLSDENLTINGLAAYQRLYDLTRSSGDMLRVRLSFVRKGDFIYTLAALSSSGAFGGFDSSFRRILGSFRELSDPAFINRSPRRLRIIQAPGGRSLQAIFQAEGMDKELWPKAALLNELKLTDGPAAGRWVKVIR
jgi:predicted Zn-dependent protease